MRQHAVVLLLITVSCAIQSNAQGKFSGYMFGDYFYNVARDSSFRRGNLPNSVVNGQRDLQAFQMRRIYFTYDNNIAEHFATRFRIEADGSAGSKDVDGNGKITVFVKDAYLVWKDIFAQSNLVFGLQPTSAFEMSEGAWGYRSLEKTIMDLRGIIPSRELGITLKGNLVESGTVNYWVSIANNTGTSNPNGTVADVDKFKWYSISLQVKPTNRIQASIYGSYLARPDVNDIANPGSTVSNGTITGAVFIGYNEEERYSIGAEGFLASRANANPDNPSLPRSLKSLNALGLTVFGTLNISSDVTLVGRYDYFDPNANANFNGDMRNFFLAGLAFKPDKSVTITPNVEIETYEKIPNGHSFDASVTGRLTFYFVFL